MWQWERKKVTYFNKLSFTEYGIWDLKLFLFILQTNQSILKKLVRTIAHFFNDCREFVLAIFCVFHTYFRLLNRCRLSNRHIHGIFFFPNTINVALLLLINCNPKKDCNLEKKVLKIISIVLLLFGTLDYLRPYLVFHI